LPGRKEIPIDFRDEWTEGGYEMCSPELISLIERAAKSGYFFDPTYSGKGLRGLTSLVCNHEIPPGSKVLFWHTGGLMNLNAADHYIEGTTQL
jgi:D-cysteine desulfhydrase